MSQDPKELGYDTSPPRNYLILLFGVLSVAVLVGLIPFFHGYFDTIWMRTTASRRAQETGRGVLHERVRQEQAQVLGEARVSVDQVIEAMSRAGRRAGGSVVAPEQNENVQAVLGWTQLPHPEAEAHARAAVEARLAAEEEAERAEAEAAAAAAEAEAAATEDGEAE